MFLGVSSAAAVRNKLGRAAVKGAQAVKYSNAGTMEFLYAFAFFVLAFLGWAAAGASFSLVGMLRSTVILAVPVTLGALSGLTCERVAVINIPIEGQLLTPAFVGTIVGSSAGTWGGLLGAMAIGALLGFVLAVLVIKYQV